MAAMPPFPPFDPDDGRRAPPQLRQVPVRPILLPNLVTLLALCAGLTSIRYAFEGRFDIAIYAVAVRRAAGRPRRPRGAAAEVRPRASAPSSIRSPISSISAWRPPSCSTSGRFDDLELRRLDRGARSSPSAPPFASRASMWRSKGRAGPIGRRAYFVGVPAPAGAMIAHAAALYRVPRRPAWRLDRAGSHSSISLPSALLMISRVPTWSGKLIGKVVPRDLVAPIFDYRRDHRRPAVQLHLAGADDRFARLSGGAAAVLACLARPHAGGFGAARGQLECRAACRYDPDPSGAAVRAGKAAHKARNASAESRSRINRKVRRRSVT